MIEAKLRPVDDFWDTPTRERKIRDAHRDQVDSYQRALGLASRISSLQAAPGWRDFVQTLEDCHSARVAEMVSHQGTSEQLWVLQGRLRELKGLLALVRHPDRNKEALAQTLKELQDSFSRETEPRLGPEIKT